MQLFSEIMKSYLFPPITIIVSWFVIHIPLYLTAIWRDFFYIFLLYFLYFHSNICVYTCIRLLLFFLVTYFLMSHFSILYIFIRMFARLFACLHPKSEIILICVYRCKYMAIAILICIQKQKKLKMIIKLKFGR